MVDTLKNVFSGIVPFWGSNKSSKTKDDNDSICGAYVMDKGPGHRGPVLGSYIIEPLHVESSSGKTDVHSPSESSSPFVVSITPTGVFILTSSANVYSPSVPGDAFTSSTLFPLTSNTSLELTKECGVVLGTQLGGLELIEVQTNGQIRSLRRCVEPVAGCITSLKRVPAYPNLIAVGTDTGKLLLWDPVLHYYSPLVSVSVMGNMRPDGSTHKSPVTCIAPVGDDGLWVSTPKDGVVAYRVSGTSGSSGMVTLENVSTVGAPECSHLDKMNHAIITSGAVVSSIVVSEGLGLVLLLLSTSEVLVLDSSTFESVQRYPASLLTCGTSLLTMTAVEEHNSVPRTGTSGSSSSNVSSNHNPSTILLLGGIDGSVSVRRLSRRKKDNKLQCVLLKTYNFSPDEIGNHEDAPHIVSTPITCLSTYFSSEVQNSKKQNQSTSNLYCVAGDAHCTVHVFRIPHEESSQNVRASGTSNSVSSRGSSSSSFGTRESSQLPSRVVVDEEEEYMNRLRMMEEQQNKS